MSHRLEELKEWDGLCEYIEQYPHLPSDHSAIKAALSGVKDDQSKRRAKICEKFAAEFEWERFVANKQQSSKSAGPLPQFSLKACDLTTETFEHLLKWAHRRHAPYSLQVECDWSFDIEEDAVPLFIDFIKASHARELVFQDVESEDRWTTYVTSVEGLGIHDISEHAQCLNLNKTWTKDGHIPRLCQILSSPKCKVKKLLVDGVPLARVVGTLIKARHLLKELQELRVRGGTNCRDVCYLGWNHCERLVATLKQSCRELQIIDLDSGSLWPAESIEGHLERLLEEHVSLRSVTVRSARSEENERFSWTNANSFYQSVCAHENLQELVLPMEEEWVPAALSLIKHCGNPNASLNHLKLGNSVEMTHVGDPDTSWTNSVLGVDVIDTPIRGTPDESGMRVHISSSLLCNLQVTEIPNVSQLCLSGHMSGQVFASMLPEPTNISGFALLDAKFNKKESVGCWLDWVQRCTQLQWIRLSCVTFQSFCPSSQLQIVALDLSGTVFHAVQAMTVLLLEQHCLQTLKVVVEGAGDEDEENTQSGAERARLFAGALQRHASLYTLEFAGKYRPYADPVIFSALFGALQVNQVLKKLRLEGFLGMEGRTDHYNLKEAVLQCLPKMACLEELKFVVWRRRLEDEEKQRVCSALQPNMSLCSFFGSDGCGGFGPKVESILKRNRLLCHARKTRTNLDAQPAALWSHLLAALGSIKGESSPLFVAIRNSTSFARILLGRNKKRNGEDWVEK